MTGSARTSTRATRATAVWGAGLLTLICVGFVGLKMADSMPAIVLSHMLFLVPVGAATVVSAIAWRKSDPHTRERRVWGSLGAVMLLLFAGEASYSLSRVFSELEFVVEIAWYAAAISMVYLAAVLAGTGELERAVRIRVLADSAVILSVVGALMYAVWVEGFIRFGAPSVAAAIEATFYSIQSFIAAIAAILIWAGMRASKGPQWAAWLSAGFGVFALGLLAWPAWAASDRISEMAIAALAPEIAYMIGYGLLSIAGVMRLVGHITWEPPVLHARSSDSRPWVTVAVPAVVLAAVVALAALAVTSSDGSIIQAVAFVAMALAGVGLVVRSSAASFEQHRLRGKSLTDPITGAGNERWFQDRLTTFVGEARRSGDSFGILVLDLDGFAELNRSRGYQAGDRLLADVAHAVSEATERRGVVCRLSGDEFGVLDYGLGPDEALDHARCLLIAVRNMEGEHVTASAGVATYPRDGQTAQALLESARSALLWAKCHGKDNAVASGPGISERLDGDAVLRLAETGLRLDLARGLAAAVDMRAVGNRFHSRNVGALAVLVAEEMDMSDDEICRVEAAALLHDVGTLALPDGVLESSSRSASVRRREHVELGERFCASTGFGDIAKWVRSHHEHWDGTGFPDRLAGEEIPLEARLVALCDAYDLLTGGSGRSAALSKGAALQEIDLGIGSRFDPDLAERFISIVGRHTALGWGNSVVNAS